MQAVDTFTSITYTVDETEDVTIKAYKMDVDGQVSKCESFQGTLPGAKAWLEELALLYSAAELAAK